MTPPPAVAPAAPVSAPQSAAPPGGSPPSGSTPHGGLFGEILDSARTAAAEGHKETGKNAGDHSSDAKSSSSDNKHASQSPDGGEVIAAAIAFLTGEAPAAPVASADGSDAGSAGSPADSAAASAAPSAAAEPSSGTDATAAHTDTAQGAPAQVADTIKGDALPQVPAEKSAEPKSDSAAPSDLKPVDAKAVTPVATGAYKPQPATEAAKVATEAKAAVDSASQADASNQTDATGQAAASQSDATQPSTSHKDQVAAATPAIVEEKQSRAAIVDQAKPATAAAQSSSQSPTSSATSPTPAQEPQAGTGGHTAKDSEGHGSSGGQQAATTTAGATATSASGDSSSTNVFSVAGADNGSAARTAQSAKLPEVVRSSVTMQEAVDAVKATFTAANQAGISSARISLSPESLGGIKISLSQTPDGLIARVAADHPEAAMTLQQNAGDLKRSLEESGMSLLRLDIGSSGQQSLGGFAGSEQGGSSTGGDWTSTDAGSAEEETTSTPSELAVELANGSLVNVLA